MLSLEQLDVVFNQTTSAFRKFAVEDATWLFKRYVLRHKKMQARPKFHKRIQQDTAAGHQHEDTEMTRMRAYPTSIGDEDQRSMGSAKLRPKSSEAVASLNSFRR